MTTLFLHPNVHVLARDNGDIQVGIDPQFAIVLPVSARELLSMCNGQHSRAEIIARCSKGAENVAHIINTLIAHHLVVESMAFSPQYPMNDLQRMNHLREVSCTPEASQRRSTTHISIYGAGRLGTSIAMLLTSSGFPHIRIHDESLVTAHDVTAWGASRIDIGQRRDRTCSLLMERVNRGAVLRQMHPRTQVATKLAIVAVDQGADWPWFDPYLTDSLLASSTAHLMAVTSHQSARFTGVIEPGITGCIRCDYHRTVDRDSSWPKITEQLRNRACADLAPASLPIYVAAQVVGEIHKWMSGEPSQARATLTRWPNLERTSESWDPHPACGCTWQEI